MRMDARRAEAHPTLETLALLLAGDLPWVGRVKLGRHLRRCGHCERQLALLGASRSELRREATAQTLTGFEAIADWARLEREMCGNIAVGLAAARCVDTVKRGRSFVWRSAFAAAMAALFVAGWMTHIPGDETKKLVVSLRRWVGLEQPEFAGTIVKSTPNGIAVRSQGTTLTLMHPASALVTVSGNAAVEARYVDEQTGEVTITNVYGQ